MCLLCKSEHFNMIHLWSLEWPLEELRLLVLERWLHFKSQKLPIMAMLTSEELCVVCVVSLIPNFNLNFNRQTLVAIFFVFILI